MKWIITLLLFFPISVLADDFKFFFTAPTEYFDTTPLDPADIQHYEVYGSSISGGPYSQLGTISASGDVLIADPINKFFTIAARLNDGAVSSYSNEAVVNPPNSPTDFKAIKITIEIQ